jgi:hypothetical protein
MRTQMPTQPQPANVEVGETAQPASSVVVEVGTATPSHKMISQQDYVSTITINQFPGLDLLMMTQKVDR